MLTLFGEKKIREEALAEAGIKVSERHVRRLCVEVGLHRYGDKRGARWGKPPVAQVAG